MRKLSVLLIIIAFSIFSKPVQSTSDSTFTQGQLNAFTKAGKPLGNSPLKHTRVKTDISGFLARVTVEQEFENNFNQPIEAVYTFPLSENSAVDDMTMKIGSRTIRGKIKKREEARKIYEEAKMQGKTASLLDQERPNVFTQSVANILPNEKIIIEISYVETLKFEDGSYEFVFPMVVGPRYSPASVKKEDAAKVTPPVALKTRAGHDISIEVNLDAGVPVENISSTLHKIKTQNLSSNSAKIELQNQKTIPNKDFILKYDVTGKRIEDAILTHRNSQNGFFTMMLSPPENFSVEDVSPKEIVFVLDTSGSMSGFPIEKAKEAMKMSLEGLYPNDTFNLITFAGDTHVLFDEPVPATQANLEKAQKFLESRTGGGGTEMMKAIKAALKPSGSREHLRIVNFMTDGYIGNESEIIAEIQKNPNARVFSFGIGNGVNRFLLDKMSEEGRGEVQYVTLEDDGSKAAKQFYERIRNPLLTDISIDWNGLPVADVYPKRNPDLFDAKPVYINGRYTNAASGTIKLKGKVGGQDFEREIKINFPETEAKHDVLATLWARKRIDDLMSQNYDYDSEEAKLNSEATKLITQMGLEFRLLTEFTSFIAVEEVIRTQGGKPVKVEVPVELADGTFGDRNEEDEEYDSFAIVSGGGGGGGRLVNPSLNLKSSTQGTIKRSSTKQPSGTPNSTSSITSDGKGSGIGTGEGSGIGSGSGSGSGSGRVNGQRSSSTTFSRSASPPPPKKLSSGVINGNAVNLTTPTYPAAASSVRASGSVNIQVTIDENGNVISAQAVSGHPLLRQASEEAARNSKFKPTLISGKPVQTTGIIVYNFQNGSSTVVQNSPKDAIETVAVIEPEEQSADYKLKQKLHFWIYDLVIRPQKHSSKPTSNEAKFVNNGKAKIQIYLTDKNPVLMQNLKDSGFGLTKEKEKNVLIGEIAVEKIADLVEFKQVKYILPSVR